MKKILIATLVITASFQASAQFANTNWVYNRVACTAQTVCQNGKVLTCRTVGFNYGNAPAVANNLCRSRVVPGQFIVCQGYSDAPNAFGGVTFVPTNLQVTCY